MISKLIDTFLENFHYVNAKGKSRNCSLFCNKKLTTDLEKVAIKMRDELKAISENKTFNDAKKAEEFFKRINISFESAQAVRAKNGHLYQPKQNKPLKMLDANGRTYQSTWRKPYKPAKFERQLVTALTAVSNSIASESQNLIDMTDTLKPFQERCLALAEQFRNYKAPEKCLTEDYSIKP